VITLILSLAFQLHAVDRRDVEFRSPEGLALRGTYFSAGKPGRGILLFHECGEDTSRKSWDSLGPRLAQAGFNVFAYDEPGMGESQGQQFRADTMAQAMEFRRTKWAGAMNAAYQYLISQPGVQGGGIGVAGASCGADMALLLARSRPEQVKAMVLLAGPMDDQDKSFIQHSPSLPVLAASSTEDIDALKAMKGISTVQDLVALSKNPLSRFLSFRGAGHATQMFSHERTLEPTIVEWFQDTLQSKRASAANDRLGQTNFPTPCAPETEETFNRAVALLHSFQYTQAEKIFSEVAQRDPACALAHWGKAMSFYHQLWDWPDSGAMNKGREYIQNAVALGTGTERERGYIAAAGVFFRDDPHLDRASRVTAYSNAMKSLREKYPEDHEAAALYALSLISIPARGEQELGNRKKAIAILQGLFANEPEHPGAAHYLIHATDTPELAQIGLDAARHYAGIAPDSSHALHMPSHIFTRLGLWKESAASNLASAVAAQNATKSQTDNQSSYQLHAMLYLEYAYLQSGRNADARRVLDELGGVPGTSPSRVAHLQAVFRVLYAIENHQWKEAAHLADPSSDDPDDKVLVSWARAIGEARTGDIDGAKAEIGRLQEFYSASISGPPSMRSMSMAPPQHHEGKGVEQIEAEAWLLFAEGKPAKAVQSMLAAAAREDTEGEALFGMRMPAREMLADLQLESRHPETALAEYKKVLQKTPNRFDSLYGAAYAAGLSGNTTDARRYYSDLLESCGPGADRPQLTEAQAYLDKSAAMAGTGAF
jgi:dienelactone hydrolase